MDKQNRKEIKLVNLPVAAVEFIRLVVKRMRYRRVIQDDVRAELEAHFEDELKGCKADTEREEKAKQPSRLLLPITLLSLTALIDP